MSEPAEELVGANQHSAFLCGRKAHTKGSSERCLKRRGTQETLGSESSKRSLKPGKHRSQHLVLMVLDVPHGCGSKNRYQNETLVSGNMDQNLRNPSCLILSHTQIARLQVQAADPGVSPQWFQDFFISRFLPGASLDSLSLWKPCIQEPLSWWFGGLGGLRLGEWDTNYQLEVC